MEGKGWFVIYGVLFILVIYLFFALQKTNGQVKALTAAVIRLQTNGTGSSTDIAPSPSPAVELSPTPSSEPQPTPDLTTSEGRDQQRKRDLSDIKEALEKYRTERGSYPNSLQSLVPAFISTLPVDPSKGKYTYRYSKNGDGYKLTAVLENKQDADDAADGKKDGIYTLTNASTT